LDNQLVKATEMLLKPVLDPMRKWQAKINLRFKQAKEWPKITAKFVADNATKVMQPREITLKDYLRLGRYYIAKRLLVIIALVLAALIYFIVIRPPEFVNNWFSRFNIVQEKIGKPVTSSGKVRLYSPDKDLKYEGAMTEGQFDGTGKLYSAPGVLEYSGEFKKGVKDGSGELYKSGKLVYKGQLAEDVLAGQGVQYDETSGKEQYKGEFKNGKREGAGQELYANGKLKYEGAFATGIYNGAGKLFREDGTLLYEGNFANGVYSGEGADYYPNGLMRYKGLFMDGKYSGAGKLLNEDGTLKYEGNFKNGEFSGEGIEHYKSGTVKYKGEYMSNKYNGQGELMSEASLPIYKGQFTNALYHGTGETYFADGVTVNYKGKFKEGRMDGIGELFFEDGTLLYKGFFKSNQLYPEGFVGLSRSQLESMMGKPTEITVNEDPLIESLLATYHDNQMAFTLRISPSNPKESFVSAVELWGTKLTSQLKGELIAPNDSADKGIKEPVSFKEADGADMTKELTRKGDFLFEFTRNNRDSSIRQVVVSSLK
jgi:antitoxin component YwqK of YwqJK toxin-antitoxin module